MEQLIEVQLLIESVTDKYHRPVDLTGASLLFQSVEGDVCIEIIVRGAVTPGAKVILDTGSISAVIPIVSPSGKYSIKIKLNR